MKTILHLSALLMLIMGCKNSEVKKQHDACINGIEVDLSPIYNQVSCTESLNLDLLLEEFTNELTKTYTVNYKNSDIESGLLSNAVKIFLLKASELQIDPTCLQEVLDAESLLEFYKKNKSSLIHLQCKNENMKSELNIELYLASPFFNDTLPSEIERLLASYCEKYFQSRFINDLSKQQNDLAVIDKAIVDKMGDDYFIFYRREGKYAVNTYAWVNKIRKKYGLEFLNACAYIISDVLEESYKRAKQDPRDASYWEP